MQLFSQFHNAMGISTTARRRNTAGRDTLSRLTTRPLAEPRNERLLSVCGAILSA
jgi:hypothetical protein